jgi:putative transposase
MPYCARKHQLQYSLIYHVYSRSNARVEIFHCDEDYRYFMCLLYKYASTLDVKVYHWVIMPNHYHLLMEIAEPETISSCMAGLNRSYACYHHRIYHTAGFLYQVSIVDPIDSH